MAGVRLSRRAFVLLLVVASAHAGKTSLKEWLLSHNHGNERLTDKVLVALEKEDVFDLGDLTALTALPRFSELEFGARMSDKTVRKWLHSVANSVLSSDTSDRDEPLRATGPPPTTEAIEPRRGPHSQQHHCVTGFASLNNDAGLAHKVQAVLEGEDVFSGTTFTSLRRYRGSVTCHLARRLRTNPQTLAAVKAIGTNQANLCMRGDSSVRICMSGAGRVHRIIVSAQRRGVRSVRGVTASGPVWCIQP